MDITDYVGGGARLRKTIRELRNEKGWSQAELAHRAGVAPSSWESGRYEPRASQLRELADALGVKMDDIELAVPGKELAAA
jgi:transcriptional regulator with XRE-family HTH domain